MNYQRFVKLFWLLNNFTLQNYGFSIIYLSLDCKNYKINFWVYRNKMFGILSFNSFKIISSYNLLKNSYNLFYNCLNICLILIILKYHKYINCYVKYHMNIILIACHFNLVTRNTLSFYIFLNYVWSKFKSYN